MDYSSKVIAVLSTVLVLLTLVLFVFALLAIDVKKENLVLRYKMLELETENLGFKMQNKAGKLKCPKIMVIPPKINVKPKPKPKPPIYLEV